MARPNIAAATSIYAGATGIKLVPTGPTLVVSNASSSGKVYFVESLVVANTDTSNAVTVTVQHWNNATPGATGATGVAICSNVSVAANEPFFVLTKQTARNLQENESLSVTAGTSGKLDVSADFKEIS